MATAAKDALNVQKAQPLEADVLEDGSELIEIFPGRVNGSTVVGVENALSAMPKGNPFSLEIVGEKNATRFLARHSPESPMEAQLAAHFPQARIRNVPDEEDPLAIEEDEEAYTTVLRVGGPAPELLPIKHSFEDKGESASDPLTALIGSMSNLQAGERAVSRLVAEPISHDWAQDYSDLAMSGAGSANQMAITEMNANSKEPPKFRGDRDTSNTSPLFLLLIIPLALGLFGYNLYLQGDYATLTLMIAATIAVIVGGVFVYFKFFRKKEDPVPTFHDPTLVRERVGSMALKSEIHITFIQPKGGLRERAEAILARVVAAYGHYDNPIGSRLEPAVEMEPGLVTNSRFEFATDPKVQGFWSTIFKGVSASASDQRSLLGTQEAAGLWHTPSNADDASGVERVLSKVIAPHPSAIASGAFIGETNAGPSQNVYLPEDALRRHMLFIARTRMGKSTLMGHVLRHHMERKAAGENEDAIVVVDPHSDMVSDVIDMAPESLADRVWYIDLSDEESTPGINVLDAHIFPDRDRAADSIMRVASGIWDQWGPRMQGILEFTVKSLHEANSSPDRSRDEQYTMLDAHMMLTDENFRFRVLQDVNDHVLKDWWISDFGQWQDRQRQEAIAPVLNRIGAFRASKRASAILGQRRSTVDFGKIIKDGDILLVGTAQGSVGQGVSALIGASVLNLVDSVIRGQGALSSEERRPTMVVIDEMQSIPGVNFDSMLSEIGKFGGSLILATQSLTKLDELSATMRDTILSNVGCLAVFSVSAVDAQRLAPELDANMLEPEDIVNLPVHNAYMRIMANGRRQPPYSFALAPPPAIELESGRKIRARTKEYTTPINDAIREVQSELAKRNETQNAVLDASRAANFNTSQARANAARSQGANAQGSRSAPHMSEGQQQQSGQRRQARGGRSRRGR